MPRYKISRTAGARRHLAARCLLLFAGATLVACDKLTSPLLKATDPDIINPADVASPDGAEALRVGALGRLTQMTTGVDPVTGNEGVFLLGGLLADEWRSGDTFQQRNETDQRNIDSTNTFMNSTWRTIGRARVAGIQA